MSTNNLSRRVAITGMCAAVAVPFSIETVAASDPGSYDPVATLKRAEEVMYRLNSRSICAGWSPDLEGGERVLRHLRRDIAEPGYDAPDEKEFQFAIEFFGRNGQSLDWVYCGEPGGMICAGAARSERAAVQS